MGTGLLWSQPMRRRYAIVGTGGRAAFYVDALCGAYSKTCELVGLCDLSPTRMAAHNARIAERFDLPAVAGYEAADFDRMVKETEPDTVIVTTVDALHHFYIVRAMQLGCDVITEKPMTIDDAKAAEVLDAVQRTGRSLRVAFNYRYVPAFMRLRQLVMDGAVGTPKLVDFSWMLDTSHGADYFRRWHREKDKSGGLLVHKASHHFDLVNWWIASWPERVFALGDLAFYGRTNAEARGEHYPYDRYTGSPEAKGDPFALSLSDDPTLRALYLDAEADSGYLRDRNVFGDGISIEDTMSVTARYRSGAILSYCLVAYSPWEGLRVAITGDRGRVELHERHGSHIIRGQDDAALAKEQAIGAKQQLWHFPMFGAPQEVEVPAATGGHGGGDPAMLASLFDPCAPPDPFGRPASHLDGAAAILLGIAANHSMESGQAVEVDDLLTLPSPVPA